jgi:hypothetical protein
MGDFHIRRSQLISPFGPGSIVDLPGNLSVVVTGPKTWLARSTPYRDEQKFKITDEGRLAARLGVKLFRWPPEFISPNNGNQNTLAGITVPVRRFPGWHHCDSCHRMQFLPLNADENTSTCRLTRIAGGICNGTLIPFRWVAICPKGHLQDVPLLRWHESQSGQCGQDPRFTYRASGGGDSLSGIWIHCTNGGCSAGGSLQQIFNPVRDHFYTCQGERPWLTENNANDIACDETLKIVIKGGSNVYQAEVRSSLFIPEGRTPREQLLEAIWAEREDELREEEGEDNDGAALGAVIRGINRSNRPRFADHGITIEELTAFIQDRLHPPDNGDQQVVADSEENFRYHEFKVFCEGMARPCSKDLSMREREGYTWEQVSDPGLITQVVLLEKLRETRALVGFQRHEILAQDKLDISELKRMMTGDPDIDWLPAHIVRGEGIFIRLNDEQLKEWEEKPKVQTHFKHLRARAESEPERFRRNGLNPRFLLLHTLAHLLIRRLTYNCGYGSSSLRERIYCHYEHPDRPMNAMVIYTASGDSEGSLGGLVKQGEPGYLERVFREALDEAEWCSADPVCADLSTSEGQELQNMLTVNGAACHNCALIPETSCEAFNKYLDRKFVIDLEGNVPSLFHLSGYGIQH